MAINYWVHDCVASEELAQNGEIYVIFDAKLTPWIEITKQKKLRIVKIPCLFSENHSNIDVVPAIGWTSAGNQQNATLRRKVGMFCRVHGTKISWKIKVRMMIEKALFKVFVFGTNMASNLVLSWNVELNEFIKEGNCVKICLSS